MHDQLVRTIKTCTAATMFVVLLFTSTANAKGERNWRSLARRSVAAATIAVLSTLPSGVGTARSAESVLPAPRQHVLPVSHQQDLPVSHRSVLPGARQRVLPGARQRVLLNVGQQRARPLGDFLLPGRWSKRRRLMNSAIRTIQEQINILAKEHNYRPVDQRVLYEKIIAPNFAVGQALHPNGAKETVYLYDYLSAGNHVLLDFAASWCPPCQALLQPHRIPSLKKAEWVRKGLIVLPINVDPSSPISNDNPRLWSVPDGPRFDPTDRYLARNVRTLAQMSRAARTKGAKDPLGTISQAYSVTSYPHVALIDPHGKFHIYGSLGKQATADQRFTALRTEIDKTLAGRK